MLATLLLEWLAVGFHCVRFERELQQAGGCWAGNDGMDYCNYRISRLGDILTLVTIPLLRNVRGDRVNKNLGKCMANCEKWST